MTKAELIRKIVKRSGIPDSEAKVFFEIFLQKASGIIRPGQAIKLKNFGYFQLRLAVFKTTPSRPNGKINQINTEVIVFSPLNEAEGEALIFNIPAVVTGRYNYIDSYFSLSTGKPVIPLQGVKDADYFMLPTGYEMKKLIETKVDKLLEDAEIIKDYVKDNEILFLKKAFFKDKEGEGSGWSIGKFDSDEFDTTGREEISARTGEANGDENFSNTTWDFGEDLSRQIEEEAIIDASSEAPPSAVDGEPAVKNSLDWDFGGEFIAEEPVDSIPDESNAKEETAETPQIDNNEFQRVKAITSEFTFDEKDSGTIKKEKDLSWDFGEDEEKITAVDEEPLDTQKPEHSETAVTENKPDTAPVSMHGKDRINPQVKEPEVLVTSINRNVTKTRLTNVNEKTKSREYHYSTKRSFLPFLVAMFTIIVVSATVFMYINKISLYDFSSGKFLKSPVEKSAVIVPVVIDRNFDIPVTYPYPKNPGQIVSADDSLLAPAVGKMNSAAAGTVPGKNNKPVVSALPKKPLTAEKKVIVQPAVKTDKIAVTKAASQKIKDNIFQRGSNYLVQVSSWHSKSIAESEAAKFKAKGYTSYIEQAELPGRGLWFRVKVGNFKSLAEAEKFASKNK
jgi:nucleoid DNA-binding protein/cell division septation protein DedD